jgi:hypothetical protein
LYCYTKQFDLLSVDIDSFDLWVWRRLLYAGYRARVVVVEFNRNFEPGCFATFPDPTGTKPHVWAGDMVFGASLDAMDLLARQHGYVLVYTVGRCTWTPRAPHLKGARLPFKPCPAPQPTVARQRRRLRLPRWSDSEFAF